MIGKGEQTFELTFNQQFFTDFSFCAEINSPVKPVFKILKKRGHKRVEHTGYSYQVKLIEYEK